VTGAKPRLRFCLTPSTTSHFNSIDCTNSSTYNPPLKAFTVIMPGFDFSNVNRNNALHARGVPLPKATSTGLSTSSYTFAHSANRKRYDHSGMYFRKWRGGELNLDSKPDIQDLLLEFELSPTCSHQQSSNLEKQQLTMPYEDCR